MNPDFTCSKSATLDNSEFVTLFFVSHPTEDEWDEFALGRLPECHMAAVEGHLLCCVICQSRLEQIYEIIRSLRPVASLADRAPLPVKKPSCPIVLLRSLFISRVKPA